jgi:hypothetical protein|tara:strand:+ start:4273 stop:4518 length:246 start_codon:yes stop_codon:yes gene_type:complete
MKSFKVDVKEAGTFASLVPSRSHIHVVEGVQDVPEDYVDSIVASGCGSLVVEKESVEDKTPAPKKKKSNKKAKKSYDLGEI